MSRALQTLRAELTATHHQGRLERMLELGRQAQRDPNSLALIDALAGGDVFERRLSLLALHTLRDGKRLLRFTEDPAASVRALAFTMAPRICDDVQALEALKVAYTLRRERHLLRNLALRRRRGVVDRYLDWLAERPGLHDFADIVPWATPDGVRRHLGRALARPSAIFWDRLARSAPAALGPILCERLRDVPGEPDAVTRQLIEKHTAAIVEGAPDSGLELLDLLFARKIFSKLQLVTRLGGTRPAATLALIERHDLRPHPGVFRNTAARLTPDELARVVRRSPHLLGPAEPLRAALSREQLQAVLSAWCDVLKDHATWGFPLLDRLTDPELRERAYQRWSVAARSHEGVIGVATVTQLPNDLREREGRRHLHEVVALGTRPAERLPYARFLPWDEATAFIKDFLGFPEGHVRSWALETLLAIPGLRPDEPAVADRALALVTARKNEQDPVRGAMLRALVAWPRAVWRTEHVPTIHRILRDALDAGDLSQATAVAAESLLVRTFRLDPAAGATWLGTFIKERGNLYDARLGAHLGDDDVRLAAPHLLQVARTWDKQQRHHQMIALADSLGDRLGLVDGLVDLLVAHATTTVWGWSALTIQRLLLRFDRPRYEATLPQALRRWHDKGWFTEILALAGHQELPGKRQPPLHPEIAAALEKIARGAGRNEHVVQAVTLLRVRAVAHFDRILADLLRSDPSYICLPVVYGHLHARRQDLLEGFLGEREIHGRFAPTGSRWLLPFRAGFHRWTPAQNVTFSAALSSIVGDRDRDTPTIWRCLAVLAAMDSAPMDRLAAAARDDRPAIQDKAIRVMARCDQGQCVPTLIGCLDDERARIAIYALRRALKDMLPRTSLHLLGEVPLRKVTVAKEVLRLLGEIRVDAAYQRLVELDATDLHRDVRIALLRALWDHLDRAPTWTVFERAVSGPDWVMASRLGDIPADRLTRETDRLLSALLARVLARPEPEARIDLLQRAANLAVSDPERSFLAACAARLSSVYDDEVGHAMRAMLYRATEVDMTRLPNLLTEALADPRCLHVAVNTLLSVPIQQRAVWVGAARAAEQVLAADPRWLPLRIRCAAAAMPGHAFGEYLRRLGEDVPLGPDAVRTCLAAVDAVALEQLADLVDRLSASTCPEVRRVAVAALVRDAGPGRGWAPERLQRLAALQADPSPLVSGAALGVFPPREMAEPERHNKRQGKPASKPA
jgi:hypothetical protein